MQHPSDNGTEITLSVIDGVQIPAQVMNVVLNSVDGAYHYDLQCQFTDGNNSNTVQVTDVHQSLVILKEE